MVAVNLFKSPLIGTNRSDPYPRHFALRGVSVCVTQASKLKWISDSDYDQIPRTSSMGGVGGGV